jgi:hypothetical protein
MWTTWRSHYNTRVRGKWPWHPVTARHAHPAEMEVYGAGTPGDLALTRHTVELYAEKITTRSAAPPPGRSS